MGLVVVYPRQRFSNAMHMFSMFIVPPDGSPLEELSANTMQSHIPTVCKVGSRVMIT